MKVNKAVLIAGVLLIVAQVFAGTGKRKGTAGALELLLPVGSVGTALGGANLAYVSGLDAIHWNPAGLAASAHSAEVMFSHFRYIAGVDVNYVAGNFKSSNFGALGLSIKTLSFGDIPVTTEVSPDGTGEMFSPSYLTLGLTYSRAMTDRIHFGTNVKLISKGVAFDFGLQYTTGTGLNLGIVLKNIGPNMKFDGGDLEVFTKDISERPDTEGENTRIPLSSFELPTSLEIALSYNLKFDEANKLALSTTFLNNNFALDEYRFAGEYGFNNRVFVRGSYVMGYDADEDKIRTADKDNYIWGPSLGGGVNFNVGESLLFNLDYAYRFTELFSDNQWMTLSVSF
jgi:hypothetical protein